MELMDGEVGPAATQYWALLFTQKTSRQQAVTPRLGGRLVNGTGRWLGSDVEREDEGVEKVDWD